MSLSSHASTRVLYGEDDREEVFESSPFWQSRARSAVVFIDEELIADDPEDPSKFLINTASGREIFNLCEDEKYSWQPVPGFCSGAWIGKDQILSAGHCIDSENPCDRTKIVFDFGYFSEDQQLARVPRESVFDCQEVKHQPVNFEPDFLVLKLDRSAEREDRTPLELDFSRAKRDERVVAIGHPMGFPLKILKNGVVRKHKKNIVVTNLDAFMGSSGSPVFRAENGKLIGVLVTGEDDFEKRYFEEDENESEKRYCYESKRCEEDSCRGEDVEHIHGMRKWLRKKRQEKINASQKDQISS